MIKEINNENNVNEVLTHSGVIVWRWHCGEYFQLNDFDAFIIHAIHPEDYLDFIKEFSMYILGNQPSFEYEYRLKRGTVYKWYKTTCMVIKKDADCALLIKGTHMDIDDLKQKELSLNKLAYKDSLTDTYNRQGIKHLMHNYFEQISNARMAVVFFDLDNFKKLNDMYGHKAGDQALRNLSLDISRILPKGYHLSRVAGDEFIVFNENHVSTNTTTEIVENVLTAIIESNDRTVMDDAMLTASAGICIYPDQAQSIDDMIKKADQAMYIAKKKGKAQYIFYDETIGELYLETTRVHKRLLESLRNDEFDLKYQAIHDLNSNKVEAFEITPIWNHPKKGTLNSQEFLHTLYEEGLIVNFNEWMIEKALKDISSLKKQGKNIKVCVNISPKHLALDHFYKFVMNQLNKYKLHGSHLTIQMVEFILKEDFEQVNKNFRKLRELGCEIVIDQFAINSSTIEVLGHMNNTAIKINPYFVKTIDQDYSSSIIFDTIFKIARKYEKVFIADGVESEKQLNIMLEKGVGYVQGSYIAKPVAFNQLDH
ncbi:EAL domain-containing protein [Haloplasma contractile]|uniref:Sensory box-GGDEF family protein n=1 Tax=Haloplasma contractile SSD-17B TaxID=1033810 RepID=U2FQ29_9MOLU|nr:EAL domain-containing protein [Haloplasma contractile]ERJ13154.1 Sensory box-GGDEF family protein [Haloplasma contractile SSD-17B]